MPDNETLGAWFTFSDSFYAVHKSHLLTPSNSSPPTNSSAPPCAFTRRSSSYTGTAEPVCSVSHSALPSLHVPSTREHQSNWDMIGNAGTDALGGEEGKEGLTVA
jgi:hypothetical protein